MYNAYLDQAAADASDDSFPCASCPCRRAEEKPAAKRGGLLELLGERLGKIRLDGDLLIALVVIWFLLSDEDETDTELLLLIGALLLFGL